MRKYLAVPLAALVVMGAASGASATDVAQARLAQLPASVENDEYGSQTIAIVITTGQGELWSGTLRVGNRSGSARFSQSKNEYAEPCPAANSDPGYRRSSSNHQISFNISRRNWPQQPDLFYINVNWSRPLEACEGEGSDSFGFNRVVELPLGKQVAIEGAGDIVVRMTRQS